MRAAASVLINNIRGEIFRLIRHHVAWPTRAGRDDAVATAVVASGRSIMLIRV